MNKADKPTPPSATLPTKSIVSSFTLSYLVGLVLLATLIYQAGFWNVVANTRVLDPMIDGGIVKYNDKDAGFVEGVADLKYYLKSQDPLKWWLIGIVILIFFVFWRLKALEFHKISKLCGVDAPGKAVFGSYIQGYSYNMLFPFHLGDVAMASDLKKEGASWQQGAATVFIFRFFILFSALVFAVIGLLFIGWTEWFNQIFWAVVIVAIAYLILYWRHPQGISRWQGAKTTWKLLGQKPAAFLQIGVLSLVAFALEDIAVYTCAMAFTSEHVILNVDFSVLLMGVVASYLARLVPLSPGGIGQFEWGFATALYVGGVGFPEAATIALLDNFFRYVSLLLLLGISSLRRKAESSSLSQLLLSLSHQKNISHPDKHLPLVAPPTLPQAKRLWFHLLLFSLVCLLIFFFDQFTVLLLDYWLLESLELSSVFWTNFQTGLLLFILAFVVYGASVLVPALVYKVKGLDLQLSLVVAITIGLGAGYLLCGEFSTYLLACFGTSFGEVDPVFNNDISFYTFTLPALWLSWKALLGAVLIAVVASICFSLRASAGQDLPGKNNNPILLLLGRACTPLTLGVMAVLGVVMAFGTWLTRYDLLFKDNSDSAVYNGADYVDVVGFLSSLNAVHIGSLVVLLSIVANAFIMRGLYLSAFQADNQWKELLKKGLIGAVLLLAIDFGFEASVSFRDLVSVQPNEPVIQLDYIKNHVDATRKAYRLDQIEDIELNPKEDKGALPSLEKILSSPTVKNASLWPGHTSYLELLVDPQHDKRILQTKGDSMVYGPTLDIFRQEQKLRTYYNFLTVNNVRYQIGDEKKMLVTSVREIPLLEPQPWLAWWGQRFVLFTHGHGMVMAPSGVVTDEGKPEYVSKGIPTQTQWPEVASKQQRIYYGEGSSTMAFSNVENMKEFDYPTKQGRAEMTLPKELKAGVKIDSLLKRIAFGWKNGQFFDMVFSGLIHPDTRVHYFRTPIERLERAASFLYFDTNTYAVTDNDQISWLVNCLTTSEYYPYSKFEYLGDKSDERSFRSRPHRRVNYLEDSVKAVVDAYTGEIRLYQISDEPVIESWNKIYPDLFTKEDMPKELRKHITYSMHLFHIQFDDVYNIYHMKEPMTFFNMEDMWDDGDEVLGPILDHGKAITFSIEPYQNILETGDVLPKSSEPTQFSTLALFTPEKALNLRAIPVVYQDGEDYGKLFCLQIPKGTYVPGPEQADAIIDQNPEIAQQIAWWNRRGTEVIRGHTTLMIVAGEVFYVEPIFLRSQQNPITQLKRVVVVFRGEAYMAKTLEEAIRKAYLAQHSKKME